MSNIKLSKRLSHALRHGADELGISISPDGYVSIKELMRAKSFRGTSFSDIIDVVNNCPKKRFEIKTDPDGMIFVRATQGHTLRHVQSDALLEKLSDSSVSRYCVHGTYGNCVHLIRTGGLNRMARNHVHLSEQGPGGIGSVVSGMRGSCDTVITVDVHAAMVAGITFFRSTNGVVLTEGLGNTGAIPPEFIVDISPRHSYRPFSGSSINPSLVVPAPPEEPVATGSTPVLKSATWATKVAALHDPTIARDSMQPLPVPATIHKNRCHVESQAVTWAAKVASMPPSPNPPVPEKGSSISGHISPASVLGAGVESSPDFFCVIDFEATCLEDQSINPQEIIEFPAVMVDAHLMRVIPDSENGVFHSYVRPEYHPKLSPFCTNLTGITQDTVDSAPVFKEVFKQFVAFLLSWGIDVYENSAVEFPKSVVFVTHGDWDLKTMLPAQCRSLNISVPRIFRQWGNIKQIYHTLPAKPRNRASRSLGMAAMLHSLGMELIGHHHSGIDDTRNIARILLELHKRGAKLGVTWDGSENSVHSKRDGIKKRR